MRARIARSRCWRSRRLCLHHYLVQQLFTLAVDLKSDGMGFLVNGRDPAQEPAFLLLVRMLDPFQKPEWKLHVLTARERRGHFIENEIEKLHRPPARQPPLPQLADYISFVQGVPRPFHRRSHIPKTSPLASVPIPGFAVNHTGFA